MTSNINLILKLILAILLLALIISGFLLASKIFFNTKEINSASESCYNNGGGSPIVETTFLTLDYSFYCTDEEK
ncbi:hypothetical protein [Niallia sp. NCCP-28]|uniref:hypothetical protein n=1 Tax=Niallia sp. NCCP-28 TaxID=2934712 RepID=UPI002085E4E3|nr:hypothetical protein [Niallia sp. NCCP-28]GKU84127.1 hypothetical protein NCCP28_35230 [Niallia sp. NCCP-28]